jgi:hypothetical protein
MLFFPALATFICGMLTLLMLGQEIRERGLRPDPSDRIADTAMLMGSACCLVTGAHDVFEALL